MVWVIPGEIELMAWLNSSPALVEGARLLSYSIYILIPAVLVAIFLTTRNAKGGKERWTAWAVLAIGASAAMATALKILIYEPRPFLELTGLNVPETELAAADSAFPSRHATVAFATAFFGQWAHAKRILAWRAFLYVWAGAIALSRVILGLHYVHDVVVGAILGVVIGWIISLSVQKLQKKIFK